MVEATVVHVESLNAYRQEVSLLLRVVAALGVHHPVTSWGCYLYLACRRHEMSRNIRIVCTGIIIWVIEGNGQVLIVESLAGVHFYLLGQHLVRRECHRIAVTIQYVAIYHDLRSLRVVFVVNGQFEIRCRIIWHLTLISQIEGKAGRLVERYIAYRCLFRPDAQLV